MENKSKIQLSSCIILGGGSSIRQGEWGYDIRNLILWEHLKDKFVISTNWSYLWCNPTVEMFSDYRFYYTEKKKLDNLPLLITKEDSAYIRHKREYNVELGKNVLLIPPCKRKNKREWYWGEDSWKQGFYSSQLIGLFALTFAIQIGCKKVFMLGADWGQINGHTHFYDDTKIGITNLEGQTKTGVGINNLGNHNTGRYDIQRKRKDGKHISIPENHPDYWHSCYKQELDKGIEIYNVSLESKINTFPKISYSEFYNQIAKEPKVNQEEIQNYIRNLIKEKLQ